ncbi:hypothetical protein THASP1DRAFT_22296 [Thamnocephalis sphaerospora]|uniref:F-box domain-containing protein n=1 Tax=Thamnocephalis sphaerospora TaxID=78915 RepID=A0A4V1IX60_9FUNG|nr:hypothetical protein THASP1DRAFT_22296 [Thamnocephalis sphaerospora]|eukprot:RKP09929.1 hypothetical protein THASP1DRAFT_22296 [Thamnocephalis sphaerospora]
MTRKAVLERTLFCHPTRLTNAVMRYIPSEVFNRIAEACDDEAALVVLSCASRQLRIRVSCQQKLWRARFELQFPQNDSKEQRWLSQYERARLAEARLGNTANRLSGLERKAPFDWFDAYCKRRAVEYRWRHGRYTVHQVGKVTAYPRGIRLQSIPYGSSGSFTGNVVASQWLPASQQRPVWFLEQPCWDGVDMQHMEMRGKWWSDEYLAIRTWDRMADCHPLHVWHLNALHRPPRTINTSMKEVYDMNIYGSWLIWWTVGSLMSKQYTVCVHNFANGFFHLDVLGGPGLCCILRTGTESCAGLLQPPTSCGKLHLIGQCRSSGKRLEKLQRIDHDRFILWSGTGSEPSPASPPNLVLVETVNGTSGVSLKERWTRSMHVTDVRPIVSRNLLIVYENYVTLTFVSLSDAANVSRVHLDCWTHNGLYPLESMWTKMADKDTWHDPRNSTAIDLHEKADMVSSPTATLYSRKGTHIVVDYTGYE